MIRWSIGWLLLVAPTLASACAVCSDGEKQNAMAFFWTTVLLTLLPLGLLGFLIRWVQKRSAELKSNHDISDLSSN